MSAVTLLTSDSVFGFWRWVMNSPSPPIHLCHHDSNEERNAEDHSLATEHHTSTASSDPFDLEERDTETYHDVSQKTEKLSCVHSPPVVRQNLMIAATREA